MHEVFLFQSAIVSGYEEYLHKCFLFVQLPLIYVQELIRVTLYLDPPPLRAEDPIMEAV